MFPKFTTSIKRDLLKKVVNFAVNNNITKYNFYERLSDEKLNLVGEEFPSEPKTHHEQYVSSLFSRRIENIHELAKSLKLINESIVPTSIGNEQIFISIYTATKFGILFNRLPAYIQWSIVSVFCSMQKLTKTTTKYKWVFGLISFLTLAFKVWHSGAIEKGWILISALVGVSTIFLLSFFS